MTRPLYSSPSSSSSSSSSSSRHAQRQFRKSQARGDGVQRRTKDKSEDGRKQRFPHSTSTHSVRHSISIFCQISPDERNLLPILFRTLARPGGPKVTEIRRDLGGAAIRTNFAFEMFAGLSFTTCMFCLGRGANDPRPRRRWDRPKPSILDFVTPKSFLPSFVRPTDPEASLHFSPPHSAPGPDLSLPAS